MPRQPRNAADRNIGQRADGRFEVRVTVVDPVTGATRRVSRYADTRAEARALRNQLEAEARVGALRPEVDRRTVAEWLAEWHATVIAPHRRPGTIVNHRAVIDNHLAPRLGGHRLVALGPAHIQRFIADQLGRGLAPGTVRLHVRILRAALEHAVAMELLGRNPAARVKPPPAPAFDRPILSADQARALLAAAEAEDSRLAALVAVGVGLGLRRGEALGLRWREVDLERGEVRVTAQQTDYGPVRLDQPLKTPASRRPIPLPPQLARVLLAHRDCQRAAARAAGRPEPELVLATASGRPLDTGSVARHLDGLLRRAGLPDVRFHDLRHSAGSILAALGVHPKVAMRLLGHSTVQMAMHYAHPDDGLLREAAGRLGEAVAGG